MRLLMLVLAIGFGLAGGLLFAVAQSAIHEIEALMCWLIGAVLFSGMVVLDGIITASKKDSPAPEPPPPRPTRTAHEMMARQEALRQKRSETAQRRRERRSRVLQTFTGAFDRISGGDPVLKFVIVIAAVALVVFGVLIWRL